MNKQKQLILQETAEACMLAMDEFVGHASDLELIGQDKTAENLRELAGQIENFVISLRTKRN